MYAPFILRKFHKMKNYRIHHQHIQCKKQNISMEFGEQELFQMILRLSLLESRCFLKKQQGLYPHFEY